MRQTVRAMPLGVQFEREILEQPGVWVRVARSDASERLANALAADVVLVGSGSSLFAAQLGAIALRRRAVNAHALAATEARGDNHAYRRKTVIAVSQSGRSADLLGALELLDPVRTIALTNSPQSPLAQRADLTIDVGAGPERAIPATKSVTATVAVLLTAASLLDDENTRTPATLIDVATAVERFLSEDRSSLEAPAGEIAALKDVILLGTDYGAPVARESALKFKEATYMHAEGFEAGEFRHGSAAMLDRSSVLIGVLDRDGERIVGRALREAQASGARRYSIGSVGIDDIPRLGPAVDDAYNTLAWLVTAQLLALYVARNRGIDSDAPRGLTKAITQ